MSFKDLPTDWTTRSLYDALLAVDVIDLVFAEQDRSINSILVLLADSAGVPAKMPVLIRNIRWDDDELARAQTFSWLEAFAGQSVVVAFGHPGYLDAAIHAAWTFSLQQAARKFGLTFISAWIAMHGVVRQLGADDLITC